MVVTEEWRKLQKEEFSDEMGRTCGTYWEVERCTLCFCGENLGKHINWKKVGKDGRIIFK